MPTPQIAIGVRDSLPFSYVVFGAIFFQIVQNDLRPFFVLPFYIVTIGVYSKIPRKKNSTNVVFVVLSNRIVR